MTVDADSGEAMRSPLAERLHQAFEGTAWSPLRWSAGADGQPRIETTPDSLLGLLERLRDAPAIGMRRLVDLTAVDWLDAAAGPSGRFVLIYSLQAPATQDRLRVLVPLAAEPGTKAGGSASAGKASVARGDGRDHANLDVDGDDNGDDTDDDTDDDPGDVDGSDTEHGDGDAAPALDSVVRLWPAARWLEREVFDLFGIRFRGHPDLRRILLEPGFAGAPLRKDHPVAGETPPSPPPSPPPETA